MSRARPPADAFADPLFAVRSETHSTNSPAWLEPAFVAFANKRTSILQ